MPSQSTTPTPTNSSTPTTSATSGQPSIRNFLRNGGLRQAAASAFDLPQTRGAEGGVLTETNEDMEVEPHEEDTQGNRKRMREENNTEASNTSDDILTQATSDSMITNTSMEHTNRRRRVSSTNPDLLETPIASSPQVIQLLAEINQTTRNNLPLIPNEGINYLPAADDNSTVSNNINIMGMVEGINAIVKEAVHYPPAAPRLEWDDTGMVPTLPHLSPRPIPNIQEEVPDKEDDNNSKETEQNAASDIIAHMREQFQIAIDDACTKLSNLTDEKIATIKTEVSAETQQRMSNIEEEVKSNYEEHDARIINNKDRLDAQETVIQSLSVALADVEPNILAASGQINQINQHSEAIENHGENIDRIEQAVHILQRNAATPSQNAQLQSLMDRISALEAAKDDASRTIEQLKADRDRQDDFYFMRTISFRRFTPQNRGSYRAMARRILASIGCEDMISNVETISFSNRRDNMRLTFPSIQAVNDAIHWLAEGMRAERSGGRTPSLEFMVMTPPRFSEDRKILTRIGTELKKANQCRRFTFMIQSGKLKMRLIKPGSRDKIMEVPGQEENMETESNEGSNCPICKNLINKQTHSSIYACGHSFHSVCLEASLENDLKCPVCREIPEFPIPHETLQECGGCASSGSQSRDMLCASSKCLHLHTINCHHSFLREKDLYPPFSIQFVEGVRLDDEFVGCRSCMEGRRPLPIDITLMHGQWADNVPDFVNLEQNRPWIHPRRDPLVPSDANHHPTPDSDRRDQIATGANQTPIGNRPIENRDRSPRTNERRHRDGSPRHTARRETRDGDRDRRTRGSGSSTRGRNDRRPRYSGSSTRDRRR